MNCNYLEKLEFYKILDILKNFCCTHNGKKIASELMPSNQINVVEKLLEETRRSGQFMLSKQLP